MKTIYFLFLITLGSLYYTSCSPALRLNGKYNETEKVYYPRHADTAHFQYLKGFSTSLDIEIQSKFEQSITGKKDVKFMSKPYGVTVENNKIYVADIGHEGLNIIDLNKKTFQYFRPIHKDLSFILTMAIDKNEDRYLLDSKTMSVLIYDPSGKFKEKIKVPENNRPTRIKIRGDKIYISDIGTGKINIYSKSSHEFIDQIPKKGVVAGDDNFVYMPMDFDLNDDYIYIMDAGSYQVKIFTYEGELVKSFGKLGNGYGQFIRPKSIAVDKEGNIMVVDSASSLVQMFDKDGRSLIAFGMPYETEAGKFIRGLNLPVSMFIDYNNLEFYKPYVDSKYNLKYVVYVSNQAGNKMLKAYGRLELKSNLEE